MQKSKWIKHAPAIAVVVFAALALSGILLLKHYFHGSNSKPRKMIQQITVVTPPPPPPPPPKVQPPPEKEQIKQPQPQPQKPQPQAPAKSPAPQQDANASGTGPTIAAGSGGGMGAGFGGGYGQFVRQEISDWLTSDDKLKHMAYEAIVTLWIDPSGTLTRIEVDQRGGNPDAKKLIQLALQQKHTLSQPRPLEAGNRITLRVKSVL